ncbi:MAG: hypothetical protein M3449_09225 [Acidobacteriota bacterium]|nr:hypothetical protein [Acidobacteriota bacterium]
MSKIESLVENLPDPDSATRFFDEFSEKHPAQTVKLFKNDGLLLDVLTLASFSPLLAATLIQNPEYLWWLNRKRSDSSVRNKNELLESLARLSLTNSRIGPQILLASFRRRELLRIFLRDIRRLSTIAEITEEISNLADAILENALRIAKQEMDNRYGPPFEVDKKGRSGQADFCVVSLGKLGSKELNYSSDIDLLFLYSAEGNTSGGGARGVITNREYFGRLAEYITKLVAGQAGEGAAFRVDLRLRPHGRVGALAISVKDAIRYYTTEARSWERQVLIRSRASAGSGAIFRNFFSAVEDAVFSAEETVENALSNVRHSKEKIDFVHKADKSYDVKLGRGGIREIEFIAQAMQLAYGGKDRWLRSPHTLISLARLADRKLVSETELTELFDAYEYFRHLEHILQMEHGLQTHTVPNETAKRFLVAKRMRFDNLQGFERALQSHSAIVHRIFVRVFGENRGSINDPSKDILQDGQIDTLKPFASGNTETNLYSGLPPQILSSFSKSDIEILFTPEKLLIIRKLVEISPKFTAMVTANPVLVNELPDIAVDFPTRNYREILSHAIIDANEFGRQLAALRKTWSRLLLEIAVFDVFEKLSLTDAKCLQTDLAEASINTALLITKQEMSRRLSIDLSELPLAVLALGKLGGRGVDYDSDLDLVMVYDDEKPLSATGLTHVEFYGRSVEIFVNTLSSMTRDGHLYRVDLRLRPYGKNGAGAISNSAFCEYMLNKAAVWELLAYVKIRGAAGDIVLAKAAEASIRKTIYERASAADKAELRSETLSMRKRLEEEKASSGRGKDIDIKFGSGGMLDVYFAVRYLQLRDGLPDDSENRSTIFMLEKLFKANSLSVENFTNLSEGYEFLSLLDHNLRLTLGRVMRLPSANQAALKIISARMNLGPVGGLHEQLTLHRLNIRSAFESILQD